MPPPKAEARFGAGTQPKALPKRKTQPIGLTIRGEVPPDEAGRVPAVKALLVDLDPDIVIDASNRPFCSRQSFRLRHGPGQSILVPVPYVPTPYFYTSYVPTRYIPVPAPPEDWECDAALIGRGEATIKMGSRLEGVNLIAYNGGVRGDKTTIFVFMFAKRGGVIWGGKAYVGSPALIKITLTSNDSAPGLHAVWAIPSLEEGYGPFTDFRLTLKAAPNPNGDVPSYVQARCSDGWLETDIEARFDPDFYAKTPKPMHTSSLSRCSS